MKSKQQLFLCIAGLFLLLFTSIRTYSQTPSYICKITGASQLSCNVFEFDVRLQRTGTPTFQLAQFQLGININPAIIPTGGVLNVTPVAGSSGLSLNQQPSVDKFSYDATKNCILVTATPPPGVGGGTTISTSGLRLFRVRVSCTLPFVTGQALLPTWSFSFSSGYQTKMFAYVGTTNTDITVQASHTLAAPYNITFAGGYANPIAQQITSDVSALCLTGGTGATISLSSTQTNYSYYLYQDGNRVLGSGGIVIGTGSAATFGTKVTGSVISVVSPSCSGNVGMQNIITLNITTPIAASVSIGASPGTTVYSGTTVTFSPTPVNGGGSPTYQWYINDNPDYDNGYYETYSYVPSNGDVVKCEMTSSIDCITPETKVSTSNTLSITVTQLSLPTVYEVTGSGSYCIGAAGLPVGLNGSESGVTYTLTPGGLTVIGDGVTPVTFGDQLAGTYTISATNDAGTIEMSGSAVITEPSRVTPTFDNFGPYCQYATHGPLPTISNNGIHGTWNAPLNTDAPGTLSYTFMPDQGECADPVTIYITVYEKYSVEEVHTMCYGSSYSWHGQNLTTSGTYYAHYFSIHGCDSTFTLNLTVNPSYTFTQNQGICNGSSYNWRGNNLTNAGTYYAHYTTVHGCDSSYVLNLTVYPTYHFTVNQSICAGSVYTWHGQNLTVAGTYNDSHQTIHGCDSSYTLILNTYPTYAFTEGHSMCYGETYNWHGQHLTLSGTYAASYTSKYHCDSTYTLNLAVYLTSPPTGSSTQIFCNGATVNDLAAYGNDIKWYNAAVGGIVLSPSDLLVGGHTYYASQIVNGCESTDRLAVNVSFFDAPITTVSNINLCENANSVDVPITVYDFTNVGAISLTLIYDHTKLGYPTLLSKNPQLDLAWGSDFYVKTTISDTIFISAIGSGQTLAGTQTLLTLRFNKTSPITSGSLNFYDNGTSCEYAPDLPPDYTPFCDMPTNIYYVGGSVAVNHVTAGIIAQDQIICSGLTPSTLVSSAPASGDGVLAYQWQISTTSGTSGFTNILAGGTSETYSPGSLTQDAWYRRIVTSTIAAYNSICSATTDAVKITVNNVTAGTISANQTICEETVPALLLTAVAATGDGNLVYQWQISTTGATTGFADITTDGNFETYQPLALSQDAWFRRVVTSNINSNFFGGNCFAITPSIKITVNNVTAGTIMADQIVCSGSAANPLISGIAASGDGNLVFQWQQSITDATSGFTNILTGGNSATYNPGILTQDTWFRRVVTSAINSDPVTCSAITNTVAITVNNLIVGTIAANQTICYGTTPAQIQGTAALGAGSMTYVWQSSLDNVNFTDIPNSNDVNYTPGNLTQSTWFRRVVTSTITLNFYPYQGSCTATSNTVKITVNPLQKISGIFTYYNVANTLLTGGDISVTLIRAADGMPMGVTTTNSSGYYEFANLCPDMYNIVATSTHATTSAVNSTDAAQVNYYGTAPYTIEKVRFHAGDVGTPGVFSDLTINASDAMRIQKYFIHDLIFDNTWSFWKAGDVINTTSTTENYPSVILVPGINSVVNMYGLCTGDFNRSFNPATAKTMSNTLQLVSSGNIQVGLNQEFELPIRVVSDYTVGASSIILNFPANMISVEDVLMNTNDGNLEWAVSGNELRIGWYSSSPINFNASDKLFTLKLKMLDNSSAINFTLAANPLNELADGQFDVINNALIGMDAINSSAMGIQQTQNTDNGSLSSYPNPFNGTTTISYQIPFDGKVTLDVYNYIGSKVMALVNENQLQGVHSLKIDGNTLPAGIYMATLKVKNEKGEIIRTIKLVNNK